MQMADRRNMGISIHKATDDDVSAISALNQIVQCRHAQALPWLFKDVALEAATITKLLGREGSLLLLARMDGKPVGYVFAQTRHIPESALTNAYATMHVNHIAVHETARRSGIGRALVEAVKLIAREQNIRRVTADIWSFNDEAAGFFRGCGLAPYLMCWWEERAAYPGGSG